VAIPGGRAVGGAEIAPHQFDDVDAAVGAAGPQATDHQLVVHHMVADHMKRQAEPIHCRTRSASAAESRESQSRTRKRPTVESFIARKRWNRPTPGYSSSMLRTSAPLSQEANAGRWHRGADVEAAAPAGIDCAAEDEIDHGAVSVERRRAPQRE